MSYGKVKSITIDTAQGKVFVNCASNNCRPLTYTNEEYPYFSKVLKEQGETETEISLLKEFESGNLQSSLNNKYTKALKVLYYVLSEEYKPFNWRTNNFKSGSDEDKSHHQGRESQAFKDLLFKALNTKLPKEKFIIEKKGYGGLNYVYKTTSRHIFYCSEKAQAKVYDFKAQAEQVLKMCEELKLNGEVILK